MTHTEINYAPRRNSDSIESEVQWPWFVAQIKPNGFSKASTNLTRQGFRTFMPLQLRTIRHARKETQVRRPLFPGYIFLSFDPAVTQWRVINNTYGVVALVTEGRNTPRTVPKALISAMMEGCDAAGNILPPPVFRAGDRVRVLAGPFRNVLAEVANTSEGDRVRLLFDLMGRAVVASYAASELEILRA